MYRSTLDPRPFLARHRIDSRHHDEFSRNLIEGAELSPAAHAVARIIDSSSAVGTNIESALLRGATAIERAADRFNGIQPQFIANGGMARGTDTVPAMLTPGEIVMNRDASQSCSQTFSG